MRLFWEFLRFFQLQRRVKTVSYKNIVVYAVKQIIIYQQVAELYPILLVEPELIFFPILLYSNSWQKTGNQGCAGLINDLMGLGAEDTVSHGATAAYAGMC